MINKIKTRMASDEGFTLIELLVVMVILAILVAIAIPAYLSFTSKAKSAAAKSNVRSTIPAVEAWYQDNSNSYSGINRANLANGVATVNNGQPEATGLSPNAVVAANAAGDGYCVADSEDSGVDYAWYTGGANGTSVIGYGTAAEADAVCAAATYTDGDTMP